MRAKVLIVDPAGSDRAPVEDVLAAQGYGVVAAADGRGALETAARELPDAVILALRLPGLDGMAVLGRLKASQPDVEVIVLTASGDVPEAVEAMRLGAYDFIGKPPDTDRVLRSVRGAMEKRALALELSALKRRILTDEVERAEAFSRIVTRSRRMRVLFQYMEVVAGGLNPVLITGETGTGKELFGRTIHELSGVPGDFVAVSTGEIRGPMFSDALFGHQKGAFTDAGAERRGFFTRADNGTIFLDEISDLDESSQVKLLRIIQEGEYFPVGADVPRRSRARIITATSRDLEKEMRTGAFRRDLYYRLFAHEIVIPPLRERGDDVELLLDHFIRIAADSLNRPAPSYTPELLTLLRTYHFPGNVRELHGMVYDAVVRSSGGILPMDLFREKIRRSPGFENGTETPGVLPSTGGVLAGLDHPGGFPTIQEAETRLVDEALRRCGGNQGQASALLGISRQALNARLGRRKMRRERGRDPGQRPLQ